MVLKELKQFLVVSLTYTLVYVAAVLISAYLYLRTVYLWFKGSSGLLSVKRRELPPNCLNDPEYGEHCYIQIKGVRPNFLHFFCKKLIAWDFKEVSTKLGRFLFPADKEEYCPNVKLHYVEKGDKSKPLMLFVHGFPEFWYSWRYQMKHFSKHYWTVAVDLRGFGDSEKPTGVSQYKLRYLANDLKNLIDALGKKNCILVAHDWGAIIGWYFIMKYPDLIERYIMLNTPPVFSYKLKWIQIFYSWYVCYFQLPCLPEIYLSLKDYAMFDQIFRNSSSNDREAYKFMFGKPGALTYAINLYRANLLSLLYSIKKQPESTELPKGLLIYTDNDRYIHVSNFMDAKNFVENLQTSFIKHGSHFMHQRKYEDVNKVMSKFLGVDTRTTDDPGPTKSVQLDDVTS